MNKLICILLISLCFIELGQSVYQPRRREVERRLHKIKLRSAPKPPTKAQLMEMAVHEVIATEKKLKEEMGPLVGQYVPQRDANGELLPTQCSGSTGMCWCTYNKGIKMFRLTQGVSCPGKPKIEGEH